MFWGKTMWLFYGTGDPSSTAKSRGSPCTKKWWWFCSGRQLSELDFDILVPPFGGIRYYQISLPNLFVDYFCNFTLLNRTVITQVSLVRQMVLEQGYSPFVMDAACHLINGFFGCGFYQRNVFQSGSSWHVMTPSVAISDHANSAELAERHGASGSWKLLFQKMVLGALAFAQDNGRTMIFETLEKGQVKVAESLDEQNFGRCFFLSFSREWTLYARSEKIIPFWIFCEN